MKSTIKRAAGLMLALATIATFVVATSGPVLAAGLPGYEGQPGNQAGNGGSNGTNGYEGKPGNQSQNN